jgi:uroporphyrinogen-III decarboxylase
MLQPEKVETLLKKITALLKDWIGLQRETFPSIEGLLLLDDIIGFLGEPEFKAFALPYFRELYDASLPVRFLHNDAPCRVSAPYLEDMGVNLFNMGIDVKLPELRTLTRDRVALVGNIPPRDVLAAGTPESVAGAARELLDSLPDPSRVLFSCGGGMPPGVSTANIAAFVRTVTGK